MNEEGELIIYNKNGGSSFRVGDKERGNYLKFKEDGSLVLYSAKGVQKWSSGLSKKNFCVTDRCVLVMQDDGNLVAYRGVKIRYNAYWSSMSSDQEAIDNVASRTFEALCPVFGNPKFISSTLLSPDSQYGTRYWPIFPHHDKNIRLRHLKPLTKRANDKDDENDLQNRGSLFELYAFIFREWLTSSDLLIFPTSNLSRYISPKNQSIYYRQRHVAKLGGYETAQYVGTIVRLDNLDIGQAITIKSRDYINELVKKSGVDAKTNPDLYQSFDAGHVLMRLMGKCLIQTTLNDRFSPGNSKQ